MSAFAVIYERSRTPVDPGVLERVMARLSHRGPDGRDVMIAGAIAHGQAAHGQAVRGQLALGHWHFWTTPEEVGENQPLRLEGLPFTVVLDGRLDNRSEIYEQLSIDRGRSLSDAALVLHAYARWSEKCVDHFTGEYAFVIFDEHSRKLFCARDALGERTLFYSWQGNRLVIASEPWAVAAGRDAAPDRNEDILPLYFALRSVEDGQTFFKDICELLPAHALVVTESGARIWRYWQPELVSKHRGRTDEEYAAEFRALLEESVRCRMRSTAPAGVIMSGGLDSGSVVCLAARMIAPQPLTTLSYVFDELADCDERVYIAAVKERWGIQSIQIPADHLWPFKNLHTWPASPNGPHANPYRLILDQVYQRAQQEGIRVWLTGGTGDQLYNAGVNFLTDLLREGRLLDASREVMARLRDHGLRGTLDAGFLQRTGRHMLDAIPGGGRVHRRRAAPGWLTLLAGQALCEKEKMPFSLMHEHTGLLGAGVAASYLKESVFASGHNVEMRHPYRDRRLIEYVLKLPAYQLYQHGLYKHILRTAMRGLLPEIIRARRRPTSARPLFLRGVEREKAALQASMQNHEAAWRAYVRPNWLIDHWDEMLTSGKFMRAHVILWQCISYDIWYHSFISKDFREAQYGY